MLNYKEWKLLNESLGSAYTLGLKTPQAFAGVVGSLTSSATIEEAKKGKKKMMDVEPEEVEKEPEDEEHEDTPEEKAVEKDPKEDEEGHEEKETPEEEEAEKDTEKTPLFQCKKKSKCKMKKEEEEWWNSIHNMLDVSTVTQKSWDGITEDLLIPEAPEEPKAGEVGYAPQTRIGSL